MIKNLFIILAFTLVNNHTLVSQQSAIYTHQLVDFQKGLLLYNDQQYQAAQNLFTKVLSASQKTTIQSDCNYYIANCAIRLSQSNAEELVLKFVADYPVSIRRNTAYLDIANYYFDKSQFAYSSKWYDNVEDKELSENKRDEFYFNFGYSLYKTNQTTKAKKYLSQVETSEVYGSQAKYYIGFIAYGEDNYDEATRYFNQIGDQSKYTKKISYYQADLNFKLGNFKKAIALAEAQLESSSKEEISELSKIIGESFFNLNNYDEAIPYLEKYEGRGERWNNTDYYLLGYAYYQQQHYDRAISEFNNIIDGQNNVVQNAYYHLGECYIQVGKKQEALNAFKNASELDFNLKIQEDAWLNYAKISYDIGNPYQSVPQVLSDYLTNYPNSLYTEEIQGLLINSYITSKNYKEAMRLLDRNNNFDNKVTYQIVAFYRGIELFNESDYVQAKIYFNKSLKIAQDIFYTAKATFWKAETDFSLANYDDALIGYKQFKGFNLAESTLEIKNIDYNLAYNYYKQQNYDNAVKYFLSFIDNPSQDSVRLNDALLRLGDSYFVKSEFDKAIEAYDRAIRLDQLEADYAYFQKAMSHGYIGEESIKIQELLTFIKRFNNSMLRDDALYELGNSYVKANEAEKGMRIYDQLNSEYSQSSFVVKSMLRQGLILYNQGKNELALDKFKHITTLFKETSEAYQAIASARLIYIDLGRVNEYANWIKTLDYVIVSDTDLDNTSYEAAEKQYLVGNTSKAIKLFNAYLNQFSASSHTLKAHFYLAQLYDGKDLKTNAIPHYKYVVEKMSSEYKEQALLRLSEIYLNDKQWDNARPLLMTLEIESEFSQNRIFAQSNLMKIYDLTERSDNAVMYAKVVLQNLKVDNYIKSDAYAIIARNYMVHGDDENAERTYSELEQIASGELAAEALYFKAYFKSKSGLYNESNNVIQKLARDFSGYKYFAAKGLILMANNFYLLKDPYQATYILKSISENFQEFEDIVDQAKLELSRIKSEELKTNSSVIINEDQN